MARLRGRCEVALTLGRTRDALRSLESLAGLTAPGIYTDFIASAYSRLGQRGKAAALYERALASAAWLWRAPESELPGFLSAMVSDCVRLAPGEPVAALDRIQRAMPFLASLNQVRSLAQ
jgi:hypothetical protein